MEGGIHIALAAEPVFHFSGIPVTNSLLLSVIVVLLLIGLGVMVGKRAKLIPGRFQTLVEAMFETVLGYMSETLGSEKLARRYFPLITTLFLFILCANWIAFVPGVESIGLVHDGHFTALLRPATMDLNVTLALALISFLTIELSGIFMLGFLKYGSKFITFSSPIALFVGVIELLSNLARLISFSFRLFGNVFAGHVLIVVVAFFIPLIVPVPLMLFEVFVGFLQAAVFALLTLVFIQLAVEEPHGQEAH